VTEAFATCDEVRTEIPLDALSLQQVAQGLMLPEGQTLADHVPKELLERIEAFLQQEGLSLQPFLRMKPWVLAAMLTILDASEYLSDTPLDALLYERAMAADKAVGGLETVDEQLGILDSLSRPEEVALLDATLDMLQEQDDYLERLVLTYLSGNADELLQMATDLGDPLIEKYGRRLLDDRNAVMAQRIAALQRQHPERRFFFAIGAGHMAGDNGIVALLRDTGLIVERLPH
jgi:uncharacterized protein YbaP (TraB family)